MTTTAARHAADRLARARDALAAAMDHAAQVARDLNDNGAGERQIADALGVTRTTVRRWIGRQDG